MNEDYIEKIEGAERRMFSAPVEVREEGEAKFFEGYGLVYGDVADLGWFTEEIAPGAADEVMNDDIRGLFNHDPNILLGRNKSGSMALTNDTKGVKYSIRYNPDDPDHVRVMEKVKRGDVSQSSFAFSVKDDKWETRNGREHRTVLKLKRMYDVSPVTYPAYPSSTVAARSFKHTKITDVSARAALDETMTKAIEWLAIAIRRHERHMAGGEPTSGMNGDISQRLMMEEMKYAQDLLNGVDAKETKWYKDNIGEFPDKKSGNSRSDIAAMDFDLMRIDLN